MCGTDPPSLPPRGHPAWASWSTKGPGALHATPSPLQLCLPEIDHLHPPAADILPPQVLGQGSLRSLPQRRLRLTTPTPELPPPCTGIKKTSSLNRPPQKRGQARATSPALRRTPALCPGLQGVVPGG